MQSWPSGRETIRGHYLTEAKRLAFEDVAKYYADPEFANVPTEWLLSEAYGKARFDLIDPERAMPQPQPGEKLEPQETPPI